MREVMSTTITQASQLTLPAKVQRLLGVVPRDRINVVIEDGRVLLEPVLSLDAVFGSVEPLPDGAGDFETQIAEAMEERAAAVAAKLRR